MSRIKPWEIIDDALLADMSIFQLHRQTLRNPRTDAALPFFVMRTHDWCNIVALTDDDQVVLVRQARAGTASVTIEIPGGVVDPGETPLEAAGRELLEETGYASDDVRPSGIVHPNPAIMDNTCHSFVAFGCRRVADPCLDAGEDIEVLTRPLADISAMIGAGEISHALVVAAFAHHARLTAA